MKAVFIIVGSLVILAGLVTGIVFKRRDIAKEITIEGLLDVFLAMLFQ